MVSDALRDAWGTYQPRTPSSRKESSSVQPCLNHTSEIDWNALRAAAETPATTRTRRIRTIRLGPPRSPAMVGLFSGCNVENASIGTTLCAECGLISELAKSSPAGQPARLVAFAA